MRLKSSFCVKCESDLCVFPLQHLQSLEQELLQEPASVPVYFAVESEFLKAIYVDVQEGNSGDNAPTAWEGKSVSVKLFYEINHNFLITAHDDAPGNCTCE